MAPVERQSWKFHRGAIGLSQSRAICTPCLATDEREARMVEGRTWLNGETTIDEAMADPIVHLLMRSDGVAPEDVWGIVRPVSAHLREQRRQIGQAA
ncbi:MAG: hypothetical protein ACU83O_11170 [Gammaproteobacteria bacterium]